MTRPERAEEVGWGTDTWDSWSWEERTSLRVEGRLASWRVKGFQAISIGDTWLETEPPQNPLPTPSTYRYTETKEGKIHKKRNPGVAWQTLW